MKIVFITLVAVLLAGCSPHLQMKDMRMSEEVKHNSNGKIDFLIEPHESVGLKVTPSLESGNVSVYRSIFPEILFGEYHPGRLVWYGVVIDGDREYFIQAVFSGLGWQGGQGYSGIFLQNLVSDGNPSPDAKGVIFSSAMSFAYNLEGDELPIENKAELLRSFEARKTFVEKNGTRLGSLRRDDDFLKVLQKWNVFNVPGGERILSPLGEKEIKDVAAINPQYNFSQRLIGSGRFVLSPDYIGTTVSLGIDLFRSASSSTPSKGWDYLSELPSRRHMALVMKYVGQFRLELISELNRANSEILRSCGGRRYGEENRQSDSDGPVRFAW